MVVMPGIGNLLAQRPQEIVRFLGQEEHPLRRVHVGATTRRDKNNSSCGIAVTLVTVVAVVISGVKSTWIFSSVPYNATAT